MNTLTEIDRNFRVCANCSSVSLAAAEEHFCVWCGTKLMAECPRCSKPILHANGKYCYHCGVRYLAIGHLKSGLQPSQVKEAAYGIENWSRQQRQRFEAKFPPNQTLVRRKP